MSLSPLALIILLLTLIALPAASWAATGPELFKAKCAMCHGPEGKGDSPMAKKMAVRDLSSAEVQKQSDAELTTIVTKGKNKMPAYEGKLTADDIKALVGHIRSLKK